MNEPALVLLAAGVVLFFVTVEIVAAVLPLAMVLILVPAEERKALTELLSVANRTHRRRIRRVLRISMAARELSRRRLGAPR